MVLRFLMGCGNLQNGIPLEHQLIKMEFYKITIYTYTHKQQF